MLHSMQFEAEGAQAEVRLVRSNRWPSLSSQAGYTRLSDNIPSIGGRLPGADTTVTFAPVELNRYHTEISVEQPLFTGFQRRHRIQAAEHRAEAAQATVAQEQVDVAFEVRQAYWTLFEALSRQEAVETAVKQVGAHLETVRNQRETGAALERDVLAAQTRRSEVRLERLHADSDVQEARLELNRLIGLSTETRVVPQSEVELKTVAAPLDTLTNELLEAHPEVSSLRQEMDALQAERRATQGEWFPEVALTGRYVYARPNQYFFAEQDEFHGSWEAGVVVRWDLWDGGRRGAETERAEARFRAAEARLEHLEDQVSTQVAQQYIEVEDAREAVEVARQIVREAEETFRVSQRQFETGAALSEDVLEAEAALRSAQAREAEATSRYAVARAALLHALGRVW